MTTKQIESIQAVFQSIEENTPRVQAALGRLADPAIVTSMAKYSEALEKLSEYSGSPLPTRIRL
jgi:hypothetical protein